MPKKDANPSIEDLISMAGLNLKGYSEQESFTAALSQLKGAGNKAPSGYDSMLAHISSVHAWRTGVFAATLELMVD